MKECCSSSMPLIISSLALHHIVNHMIVQCHRRLTKPKLGKVKCHPQIRFQIRGGLVGNCNTCSRCEAAGVHVQKTMSSRHCILPVPGIINAGRNYTNCLLGCRFGLTEAQRPCGAINFLLLAVSGDLAGTDQFVGVKIQSTALRVECWNQETYLESPFWKLTR